MIWIIIFRNFYRLLVNALQVIPNASGKNVERKQLKIPSHRSSGAYVTQLARHRPAEDFTQSWPRIAVSNGIQHVGAWTSRFLPTFTFRFFFPQCPKAKNTERKKMTTFVHFQTILHKNSFIVARIDLIRAMQRYSPTKEKKKYMSKVLIDMIQYISYRYVVPSVFSFIVILSMSHC